MDERVLAAAESETRWCDLVCRAHGISTTSQAGHWVASRRPPGGCADAVTLRPDAQADDVLGPAQSTAGCSVHDSFAALDLAPLGFEELVRAQWIFRHPLLPTVTSAATWFRVETDEGLAEWALAADAPDTFCPELLRDESLHFLGARGPGGGVAAGALVLQSGSVAGVSNFFAKKMPADEAWRTLATAVAGHFPMVPLVSWAHDAERALALAAGFVEIGALRVWRRPADGAAADGPAAAGP